MRGLTKEDLEVMIERYEFDKMKAARYWADTLDLQGYLECCSQFDMSLTDWIGMGDELFVIRFGLPIFIKEALKITARRVNEEIKRKREEQISELKLKSQELNSSSIKPETSSTHMNKVFR